jgi:hypothetical protein
MYGGVVSFFLFFVFFFFVKHTHNNNEVFAKMRTRSNNYGDRNKRIHRTDFLFFLIVRYNYARSKVRRSTKSSDYQEQNNTTEEKKKSLNHWDRTLALAYSSDIMKEKIKKNRKIK